MTAQHRPAPDVPGLTPFLEDLLADSAPSPYIDGELARIRAMERPVGVCGTCGCTIFENPGHCTLCAWDQS